MKALVTGAAGFIGSHLVEQLLARGQIVIGLDDMSTGQLDNLVAIGEHRSFRFVPGTVLDGRLVDDLVSEADVVFHFAAAVGSFVIRDRTLDALLTNVHGTENVVHAAHRHGTRLLLASTSEIYGKNSKVGLCEDDDRVVGSPLKSRWSYSEAKAVDETLIDAYVREGGLWAVIVRLFNTVGPRQSEHYGMVLPRFVSQALRQEPLTVFGSGQQVRCFCHVHDVVPALVRLADLEDACGRAVNLGSAEPVSIERLAHRVLQLTGSSSEIVHVPYEDVLGRGYEDLQRRIPDCTLARQLVGFRPRYGLDQIIESVIDEQRSSPDVTVTRSTGT